MKAYKVTVVVVDHENMGGEEVAHEVCRSRYINPQVVSVQDAEIGEWADEHPLNQRDKFADEVKRLFPC
jgi:hypothetical protein